MLRRRRRGRRRGRGPHPSTLDDRFDAAADAGVTPLVPVVLGLAGRRPRRRRHPRPGPPVPMRRPRPPRRAVVAAALAGGVRERRRARVAARSDHDDDRHRRRTGAAGTRLRQPGRQPPAPRRRPRPCAGRQLHGRDPASGAGSGSASTCRPCCSRASIPSPASSRASTSTSPSEVAIALFGDAGPSHRVRRHPLQRAPQRADRGPGRPGGRHVHHQLPPPGGHRVLERVLHVEPAAARAQRRPVGASDRGARRPPRCAAAGAGRPASTTSTPCPSPAPRPVDRSPSRPTASCCCSRARSTPSAPTTRSWPAWRRRTPTCTSSDAPFSAEPYGLGLPPDRPEWVRYVNAVLEDVRASGRWGAIYDEWLAGVARPRPRARPAAVYAD